MRPDQFPGVGIHRPRIAGPIREIGDAIHDGRSGRQVPAGSENPLWFQPRDLLVATRLLKRSERSPKWTRASTWRMEFRARLRTERNVRGSNSRTAKICRNQLPIRLVWLAQAYALSGQKEQARRLRAMWEEPARRNEINAPAMAVLDIALGEVDRAVVRLKNASANHRLEPMSAVPSYDALRAPRFAKSLPPVETQSTPPNPWCCWMTAGQEQPCQTSATF
jgi:hypothetical protein